jgi:hypothetical protein
VSLPTDIIQLFGTGSVPVLVAGSVLGVFELGEKFASQRVKDALSKWLVTFDVQKAKALPDGTQELFERIFGERHFSLKCFIRSGAFSPGAITFITILCLLVSPEDILSLVSDSNLAFAVFTALWLTWSIMLDYFNLFKTRVILGLMIRTQQAIAEPHRSLGPAHTDGEAFDAGIVEAILCEARIENLYGRVWVAVARLPLGQGAGRGRGCQGADAGGEHVTS